MMRLCLLEIAAPGMIVTGRCQLRLLPAEIERLRLVVMRLNSEAGNLCLVNYG